MFEAKTKRNQRIIELRDKKGLSFETIAKHYGITKQTAHEIYHRDKKRQELSTR